MGKRGRPASFDRAEALERAMDLFWERGYEGVTLEDLQAAMGDISPPSFYHAFGSKEALFREVVDLYIVRVGQPAVRALDEAKAARDGIEAWLRLSAESISQRGKPHGCMMVLGAMNCSPANRGPQDYLHSIRQRAPKIIKRRLTRGVAEGELPAELDLGRIAAFYVAVAHGLGIRAGDGASRADLMAAVDGAMAAWPGLTERPRDRDKRSRKSRAHSGTQ